MKVWPLGLWKTTHLVLLAFHRLSGPCLLFMINKKTGIQEHELPIGELAYRGQAAGLPVAHRKSRSGGGDGSDRCGPAGAGSGNPASGAGLL